MSAVSLKTGSMQAYCSNDIWLSKHKDQTLFLLLPSALCSAFTVTQATESSTEGETEREEKGNLLFLPSSLSIICQPIFMVT